MPLHNGAATLSGARGEQTQRPPLTEIMNLKKNNIYFLNFLLLFNI